MDQVTASVEMIHEGQFRVLTTRYLSECGCEWVVDMWGNVRRVKICPRDTNDIRWENQLELAGMELILDDCAALDRRGASRPESQTRTPDHPHPNAARG